MKEIDWSIEIPFIFKISLVKHLYGLQGHFSIRILLFSFYIGLYSGLGWSVNHYLEKWCYFLRVHLKRIYFSFSIGYSEYSVFMWRCNRCRKFKSRKYREKFIKMLEFTIEREENKK